MATQVLLPEFVLPIRPARTVLAGHAVLIEGSVIRAVAPVQDVLDRWPEAERVALPHHVLMPGLINMHTHSPMSLLRGVADDLPLETWLSEHIWPAERRWVEPGFVRDGTRLAIAEMLRGGTTCFNEMYFFPDTIAAAVLESGMRAAIGMPIIDVETPWSTGTDDCLEKAHRIHDALGGEPRISTTLAPHALYTVDEEALGRVARLAAHLDIPVSMHLLEAAWEVDYATSTYGKGALQRLEDHGLLGDRFQAVHMVHVDDADLERLAATGTHLIHCPSSNLKLANGIAPVARCQSAGVNVSVGTDGAASNNTLDLLSEMRLASLLAKGSSGDPCALDAFASLELVTLNAARAMGLDDRIGTIEDGKQADLAAFDLHHPETQPVHDVISQIVYSMGAHQCTNVWVAGKRLLAQRRLTTLDLEEVMSEAESWNRRLSEQAAA